MAILVIFFDSNCGLCQHCIGYLRQLEARKRFTYHSLHSSSEGALLQRHPQYDCNQDTIYVLHQGSLHTHSSAIGLILKHIPRKRYQFLGSLLLWIPSALRDRAYRIIAKYRHRFFKNSCTLPKN